MICTKSGKIQVQITCSQLDTTSQIFRLRSSIKMVKNFFFYFPNYTVYIKHKYVQFGFKLFTGSLE